jgi:hypothetical protein
MVEMKLLGFAALAAAPLLLTAVAAGAASFPDCDKLDDPLAYNRCLASHGPSAARAMAAPAVREAATATGEEPSHPVHRGSNGRMSASFSIDDGASGRRWRRRR